MTVNAHHHQLFVSLVGGLPSLPLSFPSSGGTLSLARLHDAVSTATGCPPSDLRILTLGGRSLPEDGIALSAGGHTFLSATLRLRGGKGGFGSMLRAQGGRMASQKTTNFEACRDLSGRRLKTVNEAKKLADYLEKEPERQKARDERIRQKIEKGLQPPEPKKHRFNDPKFFEETEEMGEDVSSAVMHVLKQSNTSAGASSSSASRRSSSSSSPEESGSSSSSSAPASSTSKARPPKASAPPAQRSAGIASMWDEEFSSSEDDDDASEADEQEAPETVVSETNSKSKQTAAASKGKAVVKETTAKVKAGQKRKAK